MTLPLWNAYDRLICLRFYANVHCSNFTFIIFIKNNLTAHAWQEIQSEKLTPSRFVVWSLQCSACYLANGVYRRSLVNGGNFLAKVSGTFVQSRKLKFIREWKFVVRMHFRTDAIEDEVEEWRFRQIRFMKWNI